MAIRTLLGGHPQGPQPAKGQIYQVSSLAKSRAFIRYSEQVLLLHLTRRLVASLFNQSINDQHKSQHD